MDTTNDRAFGPLDITPCAAKLHAEWDLHCTSVEELADWLTYFDVQFRRLPKRERQRDVPQLTAFCGDADHRWCLAQERLGRCIRALTVQESA